MTNQIATDSHAQGTRPQLLREWSPWTAILVGLGSILGTGVFVGIGLGSGIAGPAVLIGIAVAALVAICNGLSIARLATDNSAPGATHATHGGPYGYGYTYLHPRLSFAAAWMFLCAKTTSAAAAALGIAGYTLSVFSIDNEFWRVGVGLLTVVTLVGILLRANLSWARLSMLVHIGVATAALLVLTIFIASGLPALYQNAPRAFEPFFLPPSVGISPLRSALHVSALMFAAYAGFSRVAMLEREWINHQRVEQRTIPRAVVVTILVALVLYLGVAAVAIANVGAADFAEITLDTWAPLEVIAGGFGLPGAGIIVAIGALIALLGILFTIIQTVARLLMVMGRRKDMPNPVARISKSTHTPETAIVTVGILISLGVLFGDIRIIWTLSAFCVLIYYAIINLAVLQLPAPQPRYSQGIAAIGLLSCLFLAFWIEPGIWLAGLVLIAIGQGWRWLMRSI